MHINEGDFGVKILFVCHGNICRSVAAEMIARMLAEEAGVSGQLAFSSAAATTEEIGNDIYPPMKRVLLGHGVPCLLHAARQTTRRDYGVYDYLIGMDEENLWDMRRIYGGDPEGKISLMMDWAGFPGRSVSDPWYTRDFERAYRDILQGCEGLINNLVTKI